MNKLNLYKKIIVIVGIQLVLAFFFIIEIEWSNESQYILYHSYYADVVIPFGFYMLAILVAEQSGWLVLWWQRALAVFALCTLSEILQYFGIFAFARVFDPVDIVMYAVGVLLASFVDQQVLTRVFDFWQSG